MTIECTNLTYRAGSTRILDDVTLTVRAGEKVGIVGPNGSGKTTLIRMLAGLCSPKLGTVRVDGADIIEIDRRVLARKISVVEQTAEVPWDLTVRDIISLGRIPHHPKWRGPRKEDRSAVRKAAEATRVDHLFQRQWRYLSGGERQRCTIARAFAQEAPVMLLDEPTNHLDVKHKLDLLALVRASSTTSITVLHDLNLAAMLSDRLVVMSGGAIAADGTPSEVLEPGMISDVFGVAATVTSHGDVPHVVFRDPSET